MQAIGGALPYSWSGSLPAGLSISSGGLISGTPTTAQSSTSHTLTVTDNLSVSVDFIIQISILAASIPVPFVAEILVLSETLVDASFIQIIDVGIVELLDTQQGSAVATILDYFNELAGMQFWFQGNLGVGLSGSDVTSWTDQKTGYVATAELVDKPSLVAGDLNGLDTLDFVGIAERRLLLPSTANGVLTSKPGATLYAVVRPIDLINQQVIFNIRAGTGNGRFQFGTNTTANLGVFFFGGRRLDSDSFERVVGGAISGTDWLIVTAIMDYENTSITLRVNGVQVGNSGSFQTSGVSESTSSPGVSIGSTNGAGIFDGKIFFTGFCDLAHDLATIQASEQVLSIITGITI